MTHDGDSNLSPRRRLPRLNVDDSGASVPRRQSQDDTDSNEAHVVVVRKENDGESNGKTTQDKEKLISQEDSSRMEKKIESSDRTASTENLSDVDTDDETDSELSRYEQLQRWIHRVKTTFGTPFLLLVSAVYAVQGFGSFSKLAVNYFFKDDLNLQPAQSQALMTVIMFPWGIKPLYGIISDSLPLFQYHRKSYMIVCSMLSMIGFLVLAIPNVITTSFGAVSLLLVSSLGSSVIDVVIDARVVEMSRLDPKNGANDLQSVSWISQAIGGVVGSFLSGPATDNLGVRGVFLCASLGPALVLGFSFTMEESKSLISARNFLSSAKRQVRALKGAVLTPVIWKCALWVFLSGAISPGYSQVFFYFSTDVLKFTPEFLGLVSAFGFIFLLLGTLVYNAFFKDVSFRRIFFIAQASLAAVSLLDVVLVTRANLQLGIPDKAFVLGDTVIADVVSRLKTMPVLVLSAKLCPRGVEGTLFALLMSISNFSFSVSEFWGAFICHSLGIEKDVYTNFWIAIVLRSALKLMPILFLFLIPTTDPQEIVDQLNFEDQSAEDANDSSLESDEGTPNGVARADHVVKSSPEPSPSPMARRTLDNAV
ncbi:hypothetical protein Poli38472_003653 [Pythium oligandrum]|uniref:Uncharacterized protein n=1 Tax=Pythium oligandrum TaxID=41045 RepID=A0A8K1CP88_PYTOL|nr:hypothetical protein Poli38472_003653 [Pythium oligandrum]|eukprot:TMW65888.1 hypothetical protein Poli38472_003653 [Pythium oligandrum]